MPKLIKNRQIIEDNWELVKDFSADLLAERGGENLLLPLVAWLEHKDVIAARSSATGVWLDSHELPAQLADSLHNLPVIALNFPVFRDGRPFSSARELRLNFGYQGEVRAIGDVLRDQLFYMARCGFDAFVMREDQNLETSLQAFEDFRDAYQSSVDRPDPLFRRRA